MIQNSGRGLVIQGTREWTDYQAEFVITPQLVNLAGCAFRVQGMRRYYAILVGADKHARLVKVLNEEQVLDERNYNWEAFQSIGLRVQVIGSHIQGWVNDQLLFDIIDNDESLTEGGVALVCEEGCITCESALIRPPSENL
jgi:hypothetical protein